MKVKLLVTLNIGKFDSRFKLTAKEISDSAKKAIEEALGHGEARGFNHPWSDQTFINIVKVKVVA